jgi:arylformamidase
VKMIIEIFKGNLKLSVNANEGVDISRRIKKDSQLTAFGCAPAKCSDLLAVGQGNSVNCRQLDGFSPHLHSTHTEFLGHYDKDENLSIVDECLVHMPMFMLCLVIDVEPEELGEQGLKNQQKLGAKGDTSDLCITSTSLKNALSRLSNHNANSGHVEAVVVRAQAKSPSARPIYLTADAIEFLVSSFTRLDHLLFDQPSVDRDDDGGALLAHKAFFRGSKLKTITELVASIESAKIPNGFKMLQLQYIAMDMDAVCSRPIVFDLL